jgi:hypothetical protein
MLTLKTSNKPTVLPMKTFLAIFALLWAGLQPIVADDKPTKLSLGIGGFLGASYRVELVQGTATVRYLHNPHTFTNSKGTKEEKIEIPSQRWTSFRKGLDAASVWRWKRQYVRKGVADGTVWDITIEWGDQNISSTGVNAYPNEKEFAAFKAAIRDLLGGKNFE